MLFKVEKSNWRKIGVYCITNLINKKIYIGSTTTNFRHRYLQYKSGFIRKLDNQPILYRAFRKYGFENFSFELICITSKENTLVMEQFYIDKGTDYNSCLIAGSLEGFKHPENSKTRTVVGGKHHSSKAVTKYDKKGNFIKTYASIIEACEDNNIKSKSNIIQCCKGKVFTAGGFRWSYRNEKLVSRPNRKGKHKIKVFNESEENIFISHKEVVDFFNEKGFKKVKQGAVSNAIRLKNKLYNFKLEKV